MQRLRVNMEIAQLIGSLSAHKHRIISPKDHTGGSSHFVDTTVPLTTVEVEGNGNGNIAQDLTYSPPKGPDKQDPSSNMTPRPARADQPFPGLKMLKPLHQHFLFRIANKQNWTLYKQFSCIRSPFRGAPGNET